MEKGFTTKPLIKRAVEIVGSQRKLAERLSKLMGRTIKQQHVWRWLNTVNVIAAEYVLPIEAATNGQVSRFELRPDLYPPPARARKTGRRKARAGGQ